MIFFVKIIIRPVNLKRGPTPSEQVVELRYYSRRRINLSIVELSSERNGSRSSANYFNEATLDRTFLLPAAWQLFRLFTHTPGP